MKPSELHSVWSMPDNTRLTAKQYSFRLPVHVAAKLAALCELYPNKTRTQIVADLLATAIESAAEGLPSTKGKLLERIHEPDGDAIVPPDVFLAVKAKRHERSPAVTPARVVNSPTLLTGLLRCGKCGAGMTLATGKGGKYRYYKCNTRIGRSIGACSTPAVPVAKLDRVVLSALADKVFAPDA